MVRRDAVWCRKSGQTFQFGGPPSLALYKILYRLQCQRNRCFGWAHRAPIFGRFRSTLGAWRDVNYIVFSKATSPTTGDQCRS